jgi:hypothetical protein
MKTRFLCENTEKTIDYYSIFRYTNHTLPPFFRGGVRGGIAASAVLMGVKP